jgi:hypothetical protein
MVKDGRLVGNVTHKFIFYTFAFPGPSQLRLLPKYKRIRRCDNCLILPTPERNRPIADIFALLPPPNLCQISQSKPQTSIDRTLVFA